MKISVVLCWNFSWQYSDQDKCHEADVISPSLVRAYFFWSWRVSTIGSIETVIVETRQELLL